MGCRRYRLTPLAGVTLVVVRVGDTFATTSAALVRLSVVIRRTLTMATWFLGRLASKMRRKTVTTTTPPRGPSVRDIGLSDRGPTDHNHGVMALSAMASTKHRFPPGDPAARTQSANRLTNFQPESKITHKRGRNVKYFPMSD